MDRTLKSSRIAFLALILAALAALMIFSMYNLSAVQAEEYLSTPGAASIATTKTVEAARGAILDRNGTLLAADETVYSVKISRSSLLKEDDPNDTVLKLVKAANRYGVKYNDTFPVTLSAPFQYVAKPTNLQSSRLATYLEYFGLDADITAPDLISWLRNHYKINYTVTAEDARLIIGVRYELEMRVLVNTSEYIFADNVSTDYLTFIKTGRMPSVSVAKSYKRVYYTEYAAHVIGTVGPIYADEYAARKDQGYSLTSIIGKSGVEYAFEDYLRGKPGRVTVYTDRSGAVIDEVVRTQAKAGGNVYLTIDIGLNQVAEESLAATIASINEARVAEAERRYFDGETNEYRAPELAEGGAVVVVDVKTGKVLAMASYPDYSVSTWNRATQGTYEPGSTFKMVTAWAGLNNNYISPETTIRDEGIYTKYEDLGYAPRCWVYPASHGNVNVVKAIENSCNYFFYWLSDRMGITPISEAAKQFGLGSETGIEIGEKAGILASREYKREVLNEGWWNADTLQASIGQSYNQFTPVQIASYVATIANGGTHYKTSVLDYVTSSDYSDILIEKQPEIWNVIDDPGGYFPVIRRGMRAVVTTGTAAAMFKGFSVPIAAKTGTVQSDTAAMNTGVFVCYAPANDPQIAIAVVVEKGGSGSGLTQVARDIITEYFSGVSVSETLGVENSVLR